MNPRPLLPASPASAAAPLSRRGFLRASGGAAAAAGLASALPAAVPRATSASIVSPVPPAERVPLAAVGVGGVGFSQLKELQRAGFEIVALCDVDDVYAKKAYDFWPEARRYRDFRRLLAAEDSRVAAVYVGTPDHTHAIITLAALRRGKHVCCVKPLTRTVEECRAVVAAARTAGVATQVTASPNTSETACRTCELLRAGAIGTVREVHIWSNRPLWPQGMLRPEGADPVPATFDWELWLGPAPRRPFKARWADQDYALQQVNLPAGRTPGQRGVYHPWNFRGWWDFGTGALGDMGCHYFNTPFRALQLDHPVRLQASASKVTAETAPLASVVTYDFPARAARPSVRLVWYDGGVQPPPPPEITDRPMPADGVLYVGTKGRMLGPKILDPRLAAEGEAVPRTLPRRGGTWEEWYRACRGGEPAGCPFEWAGLLTEAVLLGNIALRTGKPLAWDAAAMRFTNDEAANSLLRASYQNGWTL